MRCLYTLPTAKNTHNYINTHAKPRLLSSTQSLVCSIWPWYELVHAYFVYSKVQQRKHVHKSTVSQDSTR